MWSTHLLPLFTDPFEPGMVVSVRISSMDQIDLFKNEWYWIGPCGNKNLPAPKKKNKKKNKLARNINIKMYKGACNERDSLAIRDEITLEGLKRH